MKLQGIDTCTVDILATGRYASDLITYLSSSTLVGMCKMKTHYLAPSSTGMCLVPHYTEKGQCPMGHWDPITSETTPLPSLSRSECTTSAERLRTDSELSSNQNNFRLVMPTLCALYTTLIAACVYAKHEDLNIQCLIMCQESYINM